MVMTRKIGSVLRARQHAPPARPFIPVAHSNRPGVRYDDRPSAASKHVFISCSFMKYGDEEAGLPTDAHGSCHIPHLRRSGSFALSMHRRTPQTLKIAAAAERYGPARVVRGDLRAGSRCDRVRPETDLPPLDSYRPSSCTWIASTVTTLSRNRPIAPYEGCTSDTQSSNEAGPKQLIRDEEATSPAGAESAKLPRRRHAWPFLGLRPQGPKTGRSRRRSPVEWLVMIGEERAGASHSDFIREVIEDDLRTGKHDGRVVTRFPPEPNGYLHIGHAKSICLNFGVAEQYGGRCNLRFDDTNPLTEGAEYVDSIVADVNWLGFSVGDRALYASDYFDEMYQLAEELIAEGKAYVDDLSDEEIKEYRGSLAEPGRPSPYRERTEEENLALFRSMRAGDSARRELRAQSQDRSRCAQYEDARPLALPDPPRPAPPNG